MTISEFPNLEQEAARSPAAWQELQELLSQRVQVRVDGMWLEKQGIWCDTCWHYSEGGPAYCDCGCHDEGIDFEGGDEDGN
jgi:hypothetical protein